MRDGSEQAEPHPLPHTEFGLSWTFRAEADCLVERECLEVGGDLDHRQAACSSNRDSVLDKESQDALAHHLWTDKEILDPHHGPAVGRDEPTYLTMDVLDTASPGARAFLRRPPILRRQRQSCSTRSGQPGFSASSTATSNDEHDAWRTAKSSPLEKLRPWDA